MRKWLRPAIATLLLIIAIPIVVVGCGDSDANVVSKNLSTAAEQFEIERRIVFFNGITDTYLMTVEGRCSIEADAADGQLEVTCQVGPNQYLKHFLGLSDNVSYFVEQTDPAEASRYRYRVIFKPEVLVPKFDRP